MNVGSFTKAGIAEIQTSETNGISEKPINFQQTLGNNFFLVFFFLIRCRILLNTFFFASIEIKVRFVVVSKN